jgi:cell division protein FtsN
MPKDYVHRSKVKNKKRKKRFGVWKKLFLLIIFGLIIGGGFYTFKMIHHKQTSSIKTGAIISEAKPVQLKPQTQPTTVDNATSPAHKIKLDFYQMLPRMKVAVDTTTNNLNTQHNQYYILQLASFTDQNEALEFQTNMKRLGFNSQIQKIQQTQIVRYRIQIGPFKHKEDAEDMRDNLQRQNIDCILLSISR